jgi:hypothetical protein
VTASLQPLAVGHASVAEASVRGNRSFSGVVLPLLVLLAATGVFVASTVGIDPRAMSDLGLVSVLPVTAVAALLAVNLSFCVTLGRDRATWLLVVHVLVLMFMVYGVTTLVEGVTHYQATYRHTGIIDHLLRAKGIDGNIDAYFDWPGFFAFGALLVTATGIHSTLQITAWATLYMNLLWLGPLVLIFRALTSDRRLVWLSVWLFTITNWVGQDYFSPQSFSYFLFLVLIAVVLRWFPGAANPLLELWARLSRRLRRVRIRERLTSPSQTDQRLVTTAPSAEPASALESALLFGVFVLVFAAMVMSHQLTPTGTLLAVTATVIVGACRLRTAPILMLVMIVAWLSYAAVPYLRSNFVQLADGVGAVGNNVGASVGERLAGSPGHVLIVHLRLYTTLAIWALAAVGVIVRWRGGHRQAAAVALFAAPFPLLVLQPYGGEISLRVYLFALPFASYLAAALLRYTPWPADSWRTMLLIIATTSILLGGFLFTRYGNESTDFYTSQEVSAVRELYRIAPPGSLLLGDPNLPWRFAHYTDYVYDEITDINGFAQIDSNPQTVRRFVRNMVSSMRHSSTARGAYVIITRSGLEWLDVLDSPPGRLERVETAVSKSPQFHILYANRDAKIFALVR